jgi:hypothetical protein
MPRLVLRDGAVWGQIYVVPLHRSGVQRKERSYSVQITKRERLQRCLEFQAH